MQGLWFATHHAQAKLPILPLYHQISKSTFLVPKYQARLLFVDFVNIFQKTTADEV